MSIAGPVQHAMMWKLLHAAYANMSDNPALALINARAALDSASRGGWAWRTGLVIQAFALCGLSEDDDDEYMSWAESVLDLALRGIQEEHVRKGGEDAANYMHDLEIPRDSWRFLQKAFNLRAVLKSDGTDLEANDEHKQVETISHANSESGVPMEEEAVEDEEETEDMTTAYQHPRTPSPSRLLLHPMIPSSSSTLVTSAASSAPTFVAEEPTRPDPRHVSRSKTRRLGKTGASREDSTEPMHEIEMMSIDDPDLQISHSRQLSNKEELSTPKRARR